MTNSIGSSIAREADNVVYTLAGPEIAVASTKAYTTQLVALLLLALYMGQLKGTLKPALIQKITTALRNLPDQSTPCLMKKNTWQTSLKSSSRRMIFLPWPLHRLCDRHGRRN